MRTWLKEWRPVFYIFFLERARGGMYLVFKQELRHIEVAELHRKDQRA